MFDIHYHLLFGIDDGPESMEGSLALAEASIAEGVTHIVCTPHSSYSYKFQPAVNQERLALLNERLNGRVTLGLGCDFHLSYENIEDALRHWEKYTINGKQYLLMEFPSLAATTLLTEQLYQFVPRGGVPIITHPERSLSLRENPGRLAEYIRVGCLVQVTAASLIGCFGSRAAEMANTLVRKNHAHFVASDAHSVSGRPPAMRSALEYLKANYGDETADRLCIHNPRAAFFGEALPPQPEPEELEEDSRPRRRSFFSRNFGR